MLCGDETHGPLVWKLKTKLNCCQQRENRNQADYKPTEEQDFQRAKAHLTRIFEGGFKDVGQSTVCLERKNGDVEQRYGAIFKARARTRAGES